MNCALYARVSTNRQAQKDLSIPAQLRLMTQHAERQGWTIADQVIEPGESGTTTNRPALQELLTRIADGSLRIDVVLAHKLNRLSRNLDDYTDLRRTLSKYGVRLCYVVEQVDDTPAGRFFENVMASMAQFESANLSEETKKGMRQKVLNGGWPHRPPRGYVSVIRSGERPSRSRCEIHPTQGPLVKRLFELFATGHCSALVASDIVYREGLRSAHGTPLSPSLIRKMLTNPFYTGRIRWKGRDFAGEHRALVEPELFERVQELVQQRTGRLRGGRPTAAFPLRGIAVCGRCRGRMTGEQHGVHKYYRCSRQANRRSACDARYCKAVDAHRYIERILQGLQLSRDLSRDIEREAHAIIRRQAYRTRNPASEAQAKEAAAAINETLTELFLDGALSPEQLRRSATETQSQERTVSSLERLADQPDVWCARVSSLLAFATSLWDVYVRMSDSRRGALLQRVFTAIVLGADGVLTYALKAPFNTLAESHDPKHLSSSVIKAA